MVAARDRPLPGVTRRQLLTATLGSFAAVHPACADTAPTMLSQAAAHYRSTPNGLFSCAVCTFFVRPRRCRLVSGDISPTGWCTMFDMPD